MDSFAAVAIFVFFSLVLVAVMARGNNSGGKSDKDKSKKGASPSRVVVASTSEDTPLVPPRGPSSAPSASGQLPWFTTRWVQSWNDADRPLSRSPQGSAGRSMAADSGPSESSNQVRKRGRDEPARGLGANIPPFHRAAIKVPIVAPPPPPPPPPPPAQRQAGAAAENEVLLYQCSLCPKGFTSSRGLCGHMRAHPDREWRGAYPPPAFSRDEFRDVPGINGAGPSSNGANVAADMSCEEHQVPTGPSSKGANVAAVVPAAHHHVPLETSINPPSGGKEAVISREEHQVPLDASINPPSIGEEDRGNTSGEGGSGGCERDFDLNKTPPRDPDDRELFI